LGLSCAIETLIWIGIVTQYFAIAEMNCYTFRHFEIVLGDEWPTFLLLDFACATGLEVMH
jgi:hypothetical protein